LGLDPDPNPNPNPKPKTQRDPDSEFNITFWYSNQQMFEIFRSNFDCLLLLTLFLSELGHFDQNSDVDDEHEHKRHNKRDQWNQSSDGWHCSPSPGT